MGVIYMPYCLTLLIGVFLGSILGTVVTLLKLDEAQIEVMNRCSECGVIHLIEQYPTGNSNFCPNCGAKMAGK